MEEPPESRPMTTPAPLPEHDGYRSTAQAGAFFTGMMSSSSGTTTSPAKVLESIKYQRAIQATSLPYYQLLLTMVEALMAMGWVDFNCSLGYRIPDVHSGWFTPYHLGHLLSLPLYLGIYTRYGKAGHASLSLLHFPVLVCWSHGYVPDCHSSDLNGGCILHVPLPHRLHH